MVGHVITTTPLTLSDTTITTPTTTIDITSFFLSPSTTTFYAPSGHLHKPTLTTNVTSNLDTGLIYLCLGFCQKQIKSKEMRFHISRMARRKRLCMISTEAENEQQHNKNELGGPPKKVRGLTQKNELWNTSKNKIVVKFNKYGQPVGVEGNELT
ncbi:hypothetical protein Tco_1185729 [Tanacetum coccineum]